MSGVFGQATALSRNNRECDEFLFLGFVRGPIANAGRTIVLHFRSSLFVTSTCNEACVKNPRDKKLPLKHDCFNLAT